MRDYFVIVHKEGVEYAQCKICTDPVYVVKRNAIKNTSHLQRHVKSKHLDSSNPGGHSDIRESRH